MDTAIAARPAHTNEDCAIIVREGLVVLDGATSHCPDLPSATAYVRTLAAELVAKLPAGGPNEALLTQSIKAASETLGLTPGASPSSTVAMVQLDSESVNVLLLGDSTIVIGTVDGAVHVHTDDRLDRLPIAQAEQYRARLIAGMGYDDTHRVLLRDLQRLQLDHRNRENGYWIAEADPAAAQHALAITYPRSAVRYVIAATDGARDTLAALHIPWEHIATQSSAALRALLERCHRWEAETDPDGRQLPRAKRHDDKTVAVLRL